MLRFCKQVQNPHGKIKSLKQLAEEVGKEEVIEFLLLLGQPLASLNFVPLGGK
ncbi:DUF6254 family protein [Psychrobacillus sp. FSL H8-0483]|uniref:DUF6254 family protein n=1 Tax=Psychrobacillus sp. FSL H8-0483 TaxID=2921389 RepID=UPI00315AB063